MNTPIYSFLLSYRDTGRVRMHMPGHKGKGSLGIEDLDITEVEGADSLYHKNGIIKESERNASSLFGVPTYYSTEGSSHTIRAMLALFLSYTRRLGKDPLIYAPRNIHKSFVSAAALLGLEVEFICGRNAGNYLSSNITPRELDIILAKAERRPSALYLTSPDYLGNLADISSYSMVCKKYGMLLLVDNAHGAYLHFCMREEHPSDLGADIVCDSAHKTLPTLTGGAYLHLSNELDALLGDEVSETLMLFGSTSPSYLTLASLDLTNSYLEALPHRLPDFIRKVKALKARLISHGYTLVGDEHIKITVYAKDFGYLGTSLAAILSERGIVSEFSDSDYLVLMLTPENTNAELERLATALLSVERKEIIPPSNISFSAPQRKMSIRDAVLSRKEKISVDAAIGRVVSSLAVSCPPAVPIVISGEVLGEDAAIALKHYGITEIFAVAE